MKEEVWPTSFLGRGLTSPINRKKDFYQNLGSSKNSYNNGASKPKNDPGSSYNMPDFLSAEKESSRGFLQPPRFYSKRPLKIVSSRGMGTWRYVFKDRQY